MSYVASPPDQLINLDGDVEYNYVIAQQDATEITVDADADFEFTLTQGSPALCKIKYVGTIRPTPIYKTVTFRLSVPEGTVTHSPSFRILETGASQRVPNITNIRSISCGLGMSVDFTIKTDITVDSFGALNLPVGLAVSSTTGRITGTAPSVDGFNVITLVATKGVYSYKRYFVLFAGTGTTTANADPSDLLQQLLEGS